MLYSTRLCPAGKDFSLGLLKGFGCHSCLVTVVDWVWSELFFVRVEKYVSTAFEKIMHSYNSRELAGMTNDLSIAAMLSRL